MNTQGRALRGPFDEFLRRFSDDQRERGLTPKYIRRFGRDLDWLVEFAVRTRRKDLTLGTLTEHDVCAFLAWVQADFSFKPGTADQMRTHLHVFFSWLLTHGLIAQDPTAKVKRMGTRPKSKR